MYIIACWERNLHISTKKIDIYDAFSFSDAFSFECFNDEFFHLVSVFIRKGHDGKAELVLLDHGLYDYLPPSDRIALCKLYKGIIMKDATAMQKHSLEMGVKGRIIYINVMLFWLPNYIPNNFSRKTLAASPYKCII